MFSDTAETQYDYCGVHHLTCCQEVVNNDQKALIRYLCVSQEQSHTLVLHSSL